MDNTYRPMEVTMEVAMTPDNKTVSVYISAELRKRADDAGINLSTTLRDALQEELERQEAFANARDGMTEQRVDVTDGDRGDLTLRFTGKRIQEDYVEVFLLDDGRVLAAFEEGYETFDDAEDFANWVAQPGNRDGGDEERALLDAVAALGGRPVIDL
jgi:post-segregation antitoxin (ccd killing protein)